MRKLVFLFVITTFFAAGLISCGPKPAYKTAEGKRKLERYNALQFDREDAKAPKGKKVKKRKPKKSRY